jgi:hypothetical protein
VSGNGKRRPPRSRIEIEAASASPGEAAAIAAALEQFLAESAPAAEARAGLSPWQLAALREGAGGRNLDLGAGWGPSAGR